MGYITSGATVYIDCFLTQKGKELFFIGEDEDIIVKYFSLGDSDTNYIITNNLNITTQDDNILTEGFVPSISGNYDECSKSIAGGIKLKSEISVKGVNKVLNQYCEGSTLVETLRDPNGNVFIKKTAYSSSCGFNYYSAPLSQTFTPNIIPLEPTYVTGVYDTLYQNYYIAPYTVTVPYGTFTSGISQLDADTKTVTYINENGQTLADNNAVVTYYSRERFLPNEKVDNSLIFPNIYSRVDLFYAPNMFSSNTYLENNNKINNFVQSTKQDYLEKIKPNLIQTKPNNVQQYKGIDNIPTNEVNNLYDDFVDTKSVDVTGKILTFKLKNKLVNGKINGFIFELRNFIPQGSNNTPYSDTCTLINSVSGKIQICNLYSFNYPTPQNWAYSNVNYSSKSNSDYLFLDDDGYDTVVFNLNAPYNQGGFTFDTYKLRIASLNLLYPQNNTLTYIIPESSCTTPVYNGNTYKGSTILLDYSTKKYNNIDVLI
jgi:hypothetical protein